MLADRPRDLARLVLDGFMAQQQRFNRMTLQARERFQRGAWAEVQRAGTERILQYRSAVQETLERIRERLPGDADPCGVWAAARGHYVELAASRPDYELTETWFNSVYCRMHGHAAIDDRVIFVDPALPEGSPPFDVPVQRTYRSRSGVEALLRELLRDFDQGMAWEDLDRDVQHLLDAIAPPLRAQLALPSQARIDVLRNVFYRNKGAYVIGRLVRPRAVHPFAVPLLRNDRGELYVDALITDVDDLSILFSFTRSYFMVDAPVPSAVVGFLKDLLPSKDVSELYNAIGFFKHGKTEFYRVLRRHLATTRDRFEFAPGTPGMVMIVFTLPSLNIVFKVIRDRFAASKQVDRQTVMSRYELVKRHDRVGRMADTHKFEHLRIPRARFAPELLEELFSQAASQVVDEGETLRIRLLYTERRMEPLNLYLEHASEREREAALDDYGTAIKQLAAANIFPGDMLLKNFGVTRHGRVVFYDYDEISYLTEVNFRHIPEPQTPEQEMAAEPWYSVGPRDVFPEEFPVFLFSDRTMRRRFAQRHGELFDADYWKALQDRVREGRIVDVVPYLHTRRFAER